MSFVVPLFNCLALTQAMLASLQATLPKTLVYEIVLIDDGSTDGTREWLSSLCAGGDGSTRFGAAWLRTLLNPRNLGFAATNNRAVQASAGAVIVLLNNDVVLLPGWFEPLAAAHRSLGSRAGLVGNIQLDARSGAVDHAGIIFDLKAKPQHDRTSPGWMERQFAPVRAVPAVTAACAMVSRSLWIELGGFDEGFVNGGEDVDLCFHAREKGRTNAVALRSVIRHHVSSSAGRKLRDEANSERLTRRWRAEFVHCAARNWCRDYIADITRDPRAHDSGVARRSWLYACGLTRTPPREALEALEAALELEFVRWSALRAGEP